MYKVFSRIIYLILALVFAIVVIIYGTISLSKPSNDGKLVVDEIFEAVYIKKDQWGIPHIEAKNQHDALFAYGYTIAKDRLFQMDIQRRLARGELSEILGEDLVDIDKMLSLIHI